MRNRRVPGKGRDTRLAETLCVSRWGWPTSFGGVVSVLADALVVVCQLVGADAGRAPEDVSRVDFALDLLESCVVGAPVGTLPVGFAGGCLLHVSLVIKDKPGNGCAK